MPTKKRSSKTASAQGDARNAPSQRDENWDERLRLVGDANFVQVEWSGRDQPSWPLPKR
jgi:hypothetical protein